MKVAPAVRPGFTPILSNQARRAGMRFHFGPSDLVNELDT